MQLFKKADSCRLLADQDGPAALRHRHYDAFLDHNHRALRLLSELELLDRGAGLATLASIQRRTRELLGEVQGLLEAFSELAGNRYRNILAAFQRVQQELAPLMERSRPVLDGPQVIPFAELRPEHLGLAGAKSVNLARMGSELGLPVPGGFAVTTAAADLFLRENGLYESIDAMLARFEPGEEDSAKACRDVRESIEKAPLPQALEKALDAAFAELAAAEGPSLRVAMRSSAVGEDTEASFAGQYTTVLSVDREHVGEAYKRVLASKYTERAIVYRLKYGLTDAATPMGVGGVAMVEARASGVLYTLDPSRPEAGMARIDAAPGFGEAVVGGSASPDVYLMERTSGTLVSSSIQSKRDGGGDGQGTPEPVISEHTAGKLAGYGVRLEDHYGAVQDVEWAEDQEGRIVLLQTRPLGLTDVDTPKDEPALDLSGLETVLAAGQAASPGRVSGKAVQASPGLTLDEAEGAILVSSTATPDLARFMGRVRGLITDLGGVASHLASVAREYNVPSLMDTREATSLISSGMEITLLADEGRVLAGTVPELERKLPPRDFEEGGGPIGDHLRTLIGKISPLNLTDPEAPEFSPEGCRTLHDLIRFAHEKAMKAMFSLSDLAAGSVVSQRMKANIPISLFFIDLGGGLKENLTSCDEILPEHINSRPMRALWRGLTHPGISWKGSVPLTGENIMSLIAGSIGPENAEPPEVDSYALIAEDYLNLSVKFGYHYSNLDAYCSDDSDTNTIALQFSGGAGTGTGKELRIEFLAQVLERLGYHVDKAGDLLQASLRGLDPQTMEQVLDQTGRLLASTRLLDLAIPSRAEVEVMTGMFFNEEYDYLNRSEKQLEGYYAILGDWSRTEVDGEQVIFQDGSGMGNTLTCTLHSALDQVLGDRYERFLEKRRAKHYYPVAVARDSRCGDGVIRVELRLESGCLDRSAGLAFGLMNVGNSLVLAADVDAGELQLLSFVNNTRSFLKRTPARLSMDKWLQLEVEISGRTVRCSLDDRAQLEFTAQSPVSGYVGLWSQGETSAYFRNLEIQG